MFGIPAPWGQALLAFLIGVVPGFLFIEWAASPFGGLWKASPLATRLLLTLSQFVRGRGVLVKRKAGHYDIGTWLPGENAVLLEDGERLQVDPDKLRWGLFGRKPFAVTWEPGTDLHQEVQNGDELEVDMAAMHRMLEDVNDMESIDRTESHAEAKYTETEGLSDRHMLVATVVMILLGFLGGLFIV